MPKISVNIHDRAKEFASEGFYVNDGNILMCGTCNRRIEWKSRDTVTKHCKSLGHVQNKGKKYATKRQSTIVSSINDSKKAKEEKREFIEETVKTFMKANIPLHKLDHEAIRSYFDRYIKGSGDLPNANRLRQEYLPKIGEAARQEVKQAIAGRPLTIMVDETTDKVGRCVFAVLFRCTRNSDTPEVYLASVHFLDRANATTCSQAIIETLNTYEVSYSNVLGLVSDSAPYMLKCFGSLEIFIGPHILHITCWAHKLHLVGSIFMHELKDLNLVVCKVKSAFLNTRKLKSAYLNYLIDNFPELPAKLYPEPIITRWNSWFNSVFYLSKYLEPIMKFMKEFKPKSSPMKTLLDLTEDSDFLSSVQTQCVFIQTNCKTISDFITELEGSSYPLAHILTNKLNLLERHLNLLSQGEFGQEMEAEMKNLSKNACTNVESQLKSATLKSVVKLVKHNASTPTMKTYASIGALFDPKVVGIHKELDLTIVKANWMAVSELKSFNFNSFYLWYEEFHKAILEALKKNEDGLIDIVQIIIGLSSSDADISKTVLQLVWLPVASVDCERFFSLYNIIVTDRRQAMKHNSVESCAFLAFNQ